MSASTSAPYRPLQFGPGKVSVIKRPDGSLLLKSDEVLGDYPARLSDRLLHWAKVAPTRTFMAKRDHAGVWQHVSYAEALEKARCIGQALLDRGLSAERPLAILSDNDLEHALMALGATYAGIAYTPISPAYSIVSQDFEKLRHIADLLTPGLVFASDGASYGKAIKTVFADDIPVVVTRNAVEGRTTTLYSELLATKPSTVDAAQAASNGDTIVKFLFTSGSTKLPKAVPNTNRMMCSNLMMMQQRYPFLAEEPLVLVDWLPWNHTFGGNQISAMSLFMGGTLYIDEGKPTPKGMAETIKNLSEISPTIYYNVPKGFEEIAHAMEVNESLRKNLLSRVKMFFYAGAGLAQPIWDKLHRLAEAECGERIPMLTGLGMTETAPSNLFVNTMDVRSGMIGIPLAGLELKLVDMEGKMEIRYRGAHVMLSYWRMPNETREVFDDEGYFCSGDAAKFVDENDPDKGLMFDGRIAEDFKLATGTWVSVGPLRAAFNAAAAPYAQDAVVTGINYNDVGLLIFPHIPSCHTLSKLPADAGVQAILSSAPVREKFTEVLTILAANATGSANRVTRALLMVELPSLDKGEITDKGSINMRAVLKHRADLVDSLYVSPLGADVMAPKR